LPVLAAEPTPHLDTGSWAFSVDGLVQRPTTSSWEEIRAVPSSGFTGDIHCVTSLSKLGIRFAGVSVDTLLEAAMPLVATTHVVAYSHTGYATHLPLPDVTLRRSLSRTEVRR
jgi:DMSO/TMAO reductase YedYZ molybdopterin-dependent catalytic subunit